MKIVYFGTPECACKPLNALIDAGHEVKLVVTRADKPKGRGNKVQACPVKQRAEELGIPVMSPVRIRENQELFDAIAEIDPDFIVVFSYGRIIPKTILDAPNIAIINIHASLLPKYRGAAPIQRAVLDGEDETGVCIMKMEEGLDTGDVYARATTPIAHKTSATLFEELSDIGSKLLVEVIPQIADGSLKAVPQEDKEYAYAEMIEKEEAEINWNESAVIIDRKVRAFNDSPIARTLLNGEILKIYECEVMDGKGTVGSIMSTSKKGIEVACGEGSLLITKLQAPGKKAMDAASYLLGNKIEIGTVLGK